MLLSQDMGLSNGGHVSNRARMGSSAVESSTESIPVHPLGVKPLGNQYFAPGPSARQALGHIGILPDEMILQLLEYLQEESLTILGSTCRFLYAFCQLDELWKSLFIEYVTLPSTTKPRLFHV
jgi:hypothetical protein